MKKTQNFVLLLGSSVNEAILDSELASHSCIFVKK